MKGTLVVNKTVIEGGATVRAASGKIPRAMWTAACSGASANGGASVSGEEGEHDGVVVCGLVVHRTMVVMVREAVEDDGVGVPKNECLAR